MVLLHPNNRIMLKYKGTEVEEEKLSCKIKQDNNIILSAFHV